MRKITTAMMVVMFFSAIAMMGCATSRNIKSLDNNIQKIAEMVKGNKGDIKKIKANLGLETTVTAAAKEPETLLTPEAEKALIIKRLKAPTLAQVSDLRPKKAKVKVPKMTLDNRVEQLELWTKELTHRTAAIETMVNAHDKKFSDLQRLIAEAEDEFQHGKPKKYYFWTIPFGTDSAKLTKDHKDGLDMLAIDVLAGRIKLESDVVGYADPRGKEEYNKDLSKKRAQASNDYLVEKLGPDDDVKWQAGTKWKDYFKAVAGGPIKRYGNFKYNRRVRFERK